MDAMFDANSLHYSANVILIVSEDTQSTHWGVENHRYTGNTNY